MMMMMMMMMMMGIRMMPVVICLPQRLIHALVLQPPFPCASPLRRRGRRTPNPDACLVSACVCGGLAGDVSPHFGGVGVSCFLEGALLGVVFKGTERTPANFKGPFFDTHLCLFVRSLLCLVVCLVICLFDCLDV